LLSHSHAGIATNHCWFQDDSDRNKGLTRDEQVSLLETIYDELSQVYLQDTKLSGFLDQMDEDLEDAEVLELM
jgi:hypothetical protein